MQIDKDDIWLCSDCTMVACNGERGAVLDNRDATIQGLAALGPHLVPDFDGDADSMPMPLNDIRCFISHPDRDSGILEFSKLPCDSCHSSLAGYRARFATLKP